MCVASAIARVGRDAQSIGSDTARRPGPVVVKFGATLFAPSVSSVFGMATTMPDKDPLLGQIGVGGTGGGAEGEAVGGESCGGDEDAGGGDFA